MGKCVLIIGGGAREHTISYAYENSPKVSKVIIAPGNDFMTINRCKDVIIDKDCSLNNPHSILKLAEKYNPDIIEVAQDNAIASGAVDLLKEHGLKVFGPSKDAARIEWDKRWSREFMARHHIPQPLFKYFGDEPRAAEYVKELYAKDPDAIFYVKAAGLCSGKGALKSTSLQEALHNIGLMKGFPDDAGKVFLIEQGLVGEEFSIYAISDGKNYKILKSAQDNKTIYNFDKGDQTGGMGVVCPAMVTNGLTGGIDEQLIKKAIHGLAFEGTPYVGVLYLGGIVVDGKPINIEYNARWGDPECQTVLPGIETDYYDIVNACIDGALDKINIKQDDKTRVCIVGASRGYPNDYSNAKNKRIYGLDEVMKLKDVRIYSAGIKVMDGEYFTNGGRLFSIVAEDNNVLQARQKAYSAISMINIEGNNLHYRTDIAWRDVERYLKSSKQ
jgi:phosphoribosylamine---glycine ligase